MTRKIFHFPPFPDIHNIINCISNIYNTFTFCVHSYVMTLFWLFLAVYQLNCTRTHHTLVRKCKSKPLSPGRNWLKVRRHGDILITSVPDKLKDKLFVRNIIKYLDWDNKEICWTHHLPCISAHLTELTHVAHSASDTRLGGAARWPARAREADCSDWPHGTQGAAAVTLNTGPVRRWRVH